MRASCVVLAIGMAALEVSAPRPAAAEEAEAALPPVSPLANHLAAYLKTVQHPRTGLPASFTRTMNPALEEVSFTYDVAITGLALTHAGAFPAAGRALRTYLLMPLPAPNAWNFNTAYHRASGTPTLEYRLHGGPLFWMAIALMRYAQATGEPDALDKGLALLEWAREALPHQEGGVAMSHQDFWTSVMSVENNWVYYAALRLAAHALSQGDRYEAFRRERAEVYRWLGRHLTDRGPGDSIKALDVYTHALLVGPGAHREDGGWDTDEALAQWAKRHITELEALFQIPGTVLYDYTDAREAARVGRERIAWLEGTEQVSVAYQTWARWFEQQGEHAFAKELRLKAALSHGQVLRYALPIAQTTAIPNTNAVLPVRTFADGWEARPRSEPALNGTTWTYFAEVGYNPFTTPPPRRRK